MKYVVSIEAPGHVQQSSWVTLTPGETRNLGEVVLERLRRIALTYRMVASPPFTQRERSSKPCSHGSRPASP